MKLCYYCNYQKSKVNNVLSMWHLKTKTDEKVLTWMSSSGELIRQNHIKIVKWSTCILNWRESVCKSLLLYPVPFMKRSPLRDKALDTLEEHLDTVAGLSFSKVTESCEDLLDDGRDERDDWCFNALMGRHWINKLGFEPLPFNSCTTCWCDFPLQKTN